MKIQFQPLVSVLAISSGAVVADILSVSPEERETFHRRIDLAITPIRVIFGRVELQDIALCRYTEGLPHERGSMRVSPVVSGSGLEFQVKQGDRVILLMSDEVIGPGYLAVLRIESMDSLGTIQEYYRGAPSAGRI